MRKLTLISFFAASLACRAASITSISCTAGLATVTVANTLVANQGFEITATTVGAYNINGTAVSATASNFTFNATCAGSATGGTFQPAQQILILSVLPTASTFTVTYLFWNTTTSPTPCPACTSQWPAIAPAQLSAIQAGTTVESQGSLGLINTTSTASMNAQILALYNSVQAGWASGLTKFAGFCYNGAWSAVCN